MKASMSNGKRYVIPPAPQAALAIAGTSDLFPVRRIWCVGRNYLEHIKEMGQDEREPPCRIQLAHGFPGSKVNA